MVCMGAATCAGAKYPLKAASYVSCSVDLENQQWVDGLIAEGFDPEIPTCWILEGPCHVSVACSREQAADRDACSLCCWEPRAHHGGPHACMLRAAVIMTVHVTQLLPMSSCLQQPTCCCEASTNALHHYHLLVSLIAPHGQSFQSPACHLGSVHGQQARLHVRAA